jgi:hypothetical protein
MRRNYMQVFKEARVVPSAAMETGGREFNAIVKEEISRRVREALLELEKACVRSTLSSGSIREEDSARSMAGLIQQIRTNRATGGECSQVELDAAFRSGTIQADDIDTLLVGTLVKRELEAENNTRSRIVNCEGVFRERVSEYENAFGQYELLLARWMPPIGGIALARERIKVVPRQKNSFHVAYSLEGTASTGPFVIGEYCLEVLNEHTMMQWAVPSLMRTKRR